MKYRDDMTDGEQAELLAECDALDTAYATAAATCGQPIDAAVPAPCERPPQHGGPCRAYSLELDAEEQDAATESSLDYFNRYIAGDKK